MKRRNFLGGAVASIAGAIAAPKIIKAPSSETMLEGYEEAAAVSARVEAALGPLEGYEIVSLSLTVDRDVRLDRTLGGWGEDLLVDRLTTRAIVEIEGIPPINLVPVDENGKPCGAVVFAEMDVTTGEEIPRTTLNVVFHGSGPNLPSNWVVSASLTPPAGGFGWKPPAFETLFAEESI